MADKHGVNQGEGNRDAANRYNEATRKHVETHDVKREAEEAKRAMDGGEAEELKRAEKIGKRHAKEEDPKLQGGAKRSA
jgi:hypothetical protein